MYGLPSRNIGDADFIHNLNEWLNSSFPHWTRRINFLARLKVASGICTLKPSELPNESCGQVKASPNRENA